MRNLSVSQDYLNKKIIHIDMDYFYAQVEELKNPSLKYRPVAIGSTDGRGVLCTSNYIARKFGIKSAMSTMMAIRKCPGLIVVPPNFEDYKIVSQKVFEIFSRYTSIVEGISLDEAYLDVTNCSLFENSAFLIAKDIRDTILNETGLTCSAGISYNKFLAKYACEQKKPNGQFLIPPNVKKSFIENIDVEKISGVGKVFKQTLNSNSIYKLKDLLLYSKSDLEFKFGKFGSELYYYARGIDNRQILSERVRKSLSVENTFFNNLIDIDIVKIKLKDLYDEFMRRIIKFEKREIASVFVKIKYYDFSITTIERQYESLSLNLFTSLFLQRFTQKVLAIRLIGIGVKFKSSQLMEQLELPLD